MIRGGKSVIFFLLVVKSGSGGNFDNWYNEVFVSLWRRRGSANE